MIIATRELNKNLSLPQIGIRFDIKNQVEEILNYHKDEINYLRKKLLIGKYCCIIYSDEFFAKEKDTEIRRETYNTLILQYHPDKRSQNLNQTEHIICDKLLQYPYTVHPIDI